MFIYLTVPSMKGFTMTDHVNCPYCQNTIKNSDVPYFFEGKIYAICSNCHAPINTIQTIFYSMGIATVFEVLLYAYLSYNNINNVSFIYTFSFIAALVVSGIYIRNFHGAMMLTKSTSWKGMKFIREQIDNPTSLTNDEKWNLQQYLHVVEKQIKGCLSGDQADKCLMWLNDVKGKLQEKSKI